MGIASPEFFKIKNLILNDKLPFSALPLKFGFPLGYGFSAMLQVSSYSMNHPELSIFEVPNSSVSEFLSKNLFNSDNFASNTSFYEKYYSEKDNQNLHRLNNQDSYCDQDRESELGKITFLILRTSKKYL